MPGHCIRHPEVRLLDHEGPKLFIVETNHKPLLGVFNKPLSETPNTRLQRLRPKVVGANMWLA